MAGKEKKGGQERGKATAAKEKIRDILQEIIARSELQRKEAPQKAVEKKEEKKPEAVPVIPVARIITKIKKVKEENTTKKPEESLPIEIFHEPVVQKRIPRVPSGIQGFDEMTGGGLEQRSIILINGDAGSGKSILGLQFMYSGMLKGEAALYISFGAEPRELFYPRMRSLGMDFAEMEKKRLFFVIEYQPHEVAKLMQEEGGTIYDIVSTYSVKRIVVDPITPYLIQYEKPYDAMLALVRLFSVIRKWGSTTLLLSEWSPRMQPHPSSALAEFLADGVINIIHSRSEDGIQVRGIEIWKLAGIKYSEIARPFAFTEKGIVVYPRERLFGEHAFAERP
jgi:KaiC/GvpD/RAD55 family RecA-like ATPase